MTTTEEAIADEKAEKTRLQLISEGWVKCGTDCGNIYEPGTVLVTIAGMEVCASCLDDAGLVRIEDYRELLAALRQVKIALLSDARQQTIAGDEMEYHLKGPVMSKALNGVREAIAKAERITR